MIDLQEVAKKKKKKNYREVLCTLSSVSPIGNTLQVQDQKKLGFKMKLRIPSPPTPRPSFIECN